MSRFKLWVTGGTLASLLGLMVLAAATPAGAHAVGGDPKGARIDVVQTTLQLRPTSGPAGTSIRVKVGGLEYPGCPTDLDFVDANGVETTLEVLPPSYSFRTRTAIPLNAPAGIGTVLVVQGFPIDKFCDILHFPIWEATATFTVTPSGDLRGSSVRAQVSKPLLASLRIRPTSGPPGTLVDVVGRGVQNLGCPAVTLWFVDATGVETSLGSFGLKFKTRVSIPDGAPVGEGSLEARQPVTYNKCYIISWITVAWATFTVTP